MAGADIGGDDSVQWRVEVDHVRTTSLKQEPKGEKGWKHGGVDEVEDGKSFTITIKMPKTAAAAKSFVDSLLIASQDACRNIDRPGFPVSFALAIEGRNHDQIKVRWESKGHRRRPNKAVAKKRR